jgi:hypothetical protein
MHNVLEVWPAHEEEQHNNKTLQLAIIFQQTQNIIVIKLAV